MNNIQGTAGDGGPPANNQAPRALGARIGAAAVAALLLALLGKIIWSAAIAGAGLLVLGAIGVVGIGLFQALPLIGQKWENKLLSLRKREARQNPIEQLQNYLAQKASRVRDFRAAVVAIGTQIKSLESMIAERKAERRDYDASKQQRSVDAMKVAHQRLIEKLGRAEIALKDLHEKIEDKKFEWKFGQAGHAAIKSLNATGGQELVDEMLADEAFDSVRDNFNQVFSELEMEAAQLGVGRPLELGNNLAWDAPQVDVLDLELARQPQRQALRN